MNSKKKTLMNLFGLASEQEGEEMMHDLNKIKEKDMKLIKHFARIKNIKIEEY